MRTLRLLAHAAGYSLAARVAYLVVAALDPKRPHWHLVEVDD